MTETRKKKSYNFSYSTRFLPSRNVSRRGGGHFAWKRLLASVHSPLFSSSGAFHVNLALLATFLSTGALKKRERFFWFWRSRWTVNDLTQQLPRAAAATNKIPIRHGRDPWNTCCNFLRLFQKKKNILFWLPTVQERWKESLWRRRLQKSLLKWSRQRSGQRQCRLKHDQDGRAFSSIRPAFRQYRPACTVLSLRHTRAVPPPDLVAFGTLQPWILCYFFCILL